MDFDFEKWRKERADACDKKAVDLQPLGVFLKEMGFTHLVVHYDGAGDSGDCQMAEGYKGKSAFNARKDYGEYVETKNWKNGHGTDIPMKDWKCTANQDKVITYLKAYNESCVGDMKKIDDIAWALCETIDYDWYNNAGGQGCVIWYIEEGKIVTEGQQNTQAYWDMKETRFVDGRDAIIEYDEKPNLG